MFLHNLVFKQNQIELQYNNDFIMDPKPHILMSFWCINIFRRLFTQLIYYYTEYAFVTSGSEFTDASDTIQQIIAQHIADNQPNNNRNQVEIIH